MAISLAPDAQAEELKKKQAAAPGVRPAVAGPLADDRANIASSSAAPAIGLAPAPQAAGAPPPMTPPAMTAPAPMAAAGAPAPTAPAATPDNRLKLATDAFNASASSTQGAYDAARRENIHSSAALGQIASGGLRTREGNLQLARERDLDALRSKLVTDASVGSIEDQRAADAQKIAQQNANTTEKVGLAGIDTQKGALDLEKEKFATGSGQTQQQIDLAKKAQEESLGLEKEKLGIAKGAQDIANQVALGQLSIAQATSALDEKVRTGQLTLAERNQALAELSQSQGQGNESQRIQLAKDQLAQSGAQFGLSLAQQKELATLADKTQNRQLDISSAQGQNTLLLELARIMGAKDLSSIPPDFLAAIAKALGMAVPTGDPTVTKPVDNPVAINPTGIKPTDTDHTDTGIR